MRRIAVVCLAVLAAFAFFAAVRRDAVSETKPGTYSQVVDNSDGGRFAVSKCWKKSDSGKDINGRDYLVARPTEKGAHALFKFAIPADGKYAVYVRWPEVRGLNGSVPVGVETAYGTKWTKVDQRRDGGSWVRIGEFEMRKDEDFPVRISRSARGRGKVAADAVKVEEVSSYEEPATRTENAAPPEAARATSATGSQVVARARSFIGRGITYKYNTCTSTQMSCSCLTKRVFAKFGYNLSMDPSVQIRTGRPVSKTNLQPGDLVIFDENMNGKLEPWDHVAIYSKPGYIIHASSYFNGVVESQMKYIRGYAGARRLV